MQDSNQPYIYRVLETKKSNTSKLLEIHGNFQTRAPLPGEYTLIPQGIAISLKKILFENTESKRFIAAVKGVSREILNRSWGILPRSWGTRVGKSGCLILKGKKDDPVAIGAKLNYAQESLNTFSTTILSIKKIGRILHIKTADKWIFCPGLELKIADNKRRQSAFCIDQGSMSPGEIKRLCRLYEDYPFIKPEFIFSALLKIRGWVKSPDIFNPRSKELKRIGDWVISNKWKERFVNKALKRCKKAGGETIEELNQLMETPESLTRALLEDLEKKKMIILSGKYSLTPKDHPEQNMPPAGKALYEEIRQADIQGIRLNRYPEPWKVAIIEAMIREELVIKPSESEEWIIDSKALTTLIDRIRVLKTETISEIREATGLSRAPIIAVLDYAVSRQLLPERDN